MQTATITESHYVDVCTQLIAKMLEINMAVVRQTGT